MIPWRCRGSGFSDGYLVYRNRYPVTVTGRKVEMLQTLTANSLLTLENVKTLIDAERQRPDTEDTLIVQFGSGLRIMKRVRVTAVIHDDRETLGWELAKQYGPMREVIVVGRLGTTTRKGASFERFPFGRLFATRSAIVASGWNADKSCFVNGWQRCYWDEEQNQIWEEPYLSVATKQFRLGFVSTLEDLYAGTQAWIEAHQQEQG